jgi:hypothetical protein
MYCLTLSDPQLARPLGSRSARIDCHVLQYILCAACLCGIMSLRWQQLGLDVQLVHSKWKWY